MKAIIKTPSGPMMKDRPIPRLDRLNNILIKVRLAGICRTDLFVADGTIDAADEIVLGHEFCGTVCKTGNSVKNFKVGDWVTVDPTIFGPKQNLMCGVDCDGVFAEYVKVPEVSVYKLPIGLDSRYGAYTEPVAASMAVLKSGITPKMSGCIYGKNRISDLTYRILKCNGFNNIKICDETKVLAENSLDFVIETKLSTTDMRKIVRAVRPHGVIVLKSRLHNPVEIIINDLVKKDITMSAVNYGDFNDAVKLLGGDNLVIDDLLGDTYTFCDFQSAFDCAADGENVKIFLEPPKDN